MWGISFSQVFDNDGVFWILIIIVIITTYIHMQYVYMTETPGRETI